MAVITSFENLPLVLHVKDLAEVLSISKIRPMRWFAPVKSAASAQAVPTASPKMQ